MDRTFTDFYVKPRFPRRLLKRAVMRQGLFIYNHNPYWGIQIGTFDLYKPAYKLYWPQAEFLSEVQCYMSVFFVLNK